MLFKTAFCIFLLPMCTVYTVKLEVRKDLLEHPNRKLLPEDYCGKPIPNLILQYKNGDFPWMAQLIYSLNGNERLVFGCEGVLINRRYVLTSANCVKKPELRQSKLVRVRLGELVRSDPGCDGACAAPVQEVEVDKLIVHSNYKRSSRHEDIALLRLKDKVHFTDFVKPICLPLKGLVDTNYIGKYMTMLTWNWMTDMDNFNIFSLQVMEQEKCANFYSTVNVKLRNTQLCTSWLKNSCPGVGGSPLMLEQSGRWYAAGVQSFGPVSCSLQDVPSVFTKVSQYCAWILDHIED